jgi:hypothetical protein
METELQKLLQERLEALGEKWKANQAQRDKLEAEAKQLLHDIAAIQEALGVEARFSGQTPSKPATNGGSRLLGLNLREAVALLRRENPGISQKEVRRHLEDIRFDFKGKKPGNAINMAWVYLDAKEKREGGNGKQG